MAREDAALARHISEVLPTVVDQIEAGELMQSLQNHPGFGVVQRLLDEEIAKINSQMEGGGGPLEQAEYAVRHGRIGGLRAFKAAAETISARSEKVREAQQAQHEGDAESSPER